MSSLAGLLVYSDKLIYRIGRHLFLFTSMILLFSWIIYMRENNNGSFYESLKGVTVNAFFFFGYAYLTAYILVPFFLKKQLYFWFVLSFLFSGLFISYIKFICSDYLFYAAIAADLSSRMKMVEFSVLLTNTKDMTFIVAIFLIAKFAKDNHHLRIRLRELQDYQLRSEIKLLKNQLDPHVIFNNLNNLYCMAINTPVDIAENISRLNSLLHYYFIKGKQMEVPLEDELKTIDNFINLEKLRYGNRLDIVYSVRGKARGKKIIPFVLFSFAENCFEHGSSLESGDCWIKIEVEIEKDTIYFHASNSKPGNILESEDNGDQRKTAKQKLELLYPGKYILRIDDSNEEYCLDLKLKL